MNIIDKNKHELAPVLGESIYDPVIEEARSVLEEFGDDPQNSFTPEISIEKPLAELNNQAQIFTWDEFKEQQSSDLPWLIDGLIRPGWLGVIGGHGKQGKTTLTMHLLNHIRQGKNFINECKQSPVIYVNCEMGNDDIRELIRDVTQDSDIGSDAKIISSLPLPINLGWLKEYLLAEPSPGVCVIDSFRGAFLLTGDNENNAGSVGNILRPLQLIARQTGWTILVIHHFRKSGTGDALDLAGSGEWNSAPDLILTWQCTNFNEPGTLMAIGRIPPTEPFSIKLTRENIEFLGSSSQFQADGERARVYECLSYEGTTSTELAKLTKLPESTVRRRLTELMEYGQAMKTGEGRKGNPYLWSIATLSGGEDEN